MPEMLETFTKRLYTFSQQQPYLSSFWPAAALLFNSGRKPYDSNGDNG